uniref:Uncharacterized protein n=1 Tax=Anguilla anguilla TaxID=7936 RepID=A0A0E9XI46_ANGAN
MSQPRARVLISLTSPIYWRPWTYAQPADHISHYGNLEIYCHNICEK